ncbi:hypothetical protein ACGY6K_12760 [Burkholderia pseudomallei]
MKSVVVLFAVVVSACPAAAQTIGQNTQGACSPTLAEVAGNVNVNLTCNLSDEDLRLNARHNWEIAKRDARILLNAQTTYLLPSVSNYAAQPTPARWAEVRHQVQLIRTVLTAAMESALAYKATLPDADPSQLRGFEVLYRTRGEVLSELEVQAEPMPVPALKQWENRYAGLVNRLYQELARFDETTLSKTAKR